MKQLTLGYVNAGTGRHAPFDQVYQRARCVNPNDISQGKVDALVIWGGADISPSLYGQKAATWTGADDTLSERDQLEKDVCDAAMFQGLPIIGVCRGAQLACALAGGRLVQHVNHHAGGNHEIETDKGEILVTSSVHHQMMYPYDVDHKLLAWTRERRATIYLNETGDDEEARQKPEAEIVYFPKINALAIQGHPEFMDPNCDFVKHCNNLVREYLL